MPVSRAFLILLPLALAMSPSQKSKPTQKPKLPLTKAATKPTPKPKAAPTPKPAAISPALDPKVLQQALASAGGTVTTTAESGVSSAMVEAVATGKGRIDYGQGVARAIGLGALPPPSLTRSRAQDTLAARDAAFADALRTLSMSVQQVRVSADSRVSNYILKSDDVRLRLAGVIKSAEVVEEKLLADAGIYRVIVQIPLVGAGSVAEAVGTAPVSDTSVEVRHPRDPYAPGAPAPAGVTYTGLIIDCRGLRLQSSPSPKLWSERGDEVFGTVSVSADFLQDQGIVAYPHSLDDAKNSPRIGARPLILRARRCRDTTRCEPILSALDTQRLQEANGESRFLERCAVVFLMDP